jgi:hypothetical protein
MLTIRGFVLSLLAERWLRHQDRLPTDVRKREKILREYEYEYEHEYEHEHEHEHAEVESGKC